MTSQILLLSCNVLGLSSLRYYVEVNMRQTFGLRSGGVYCNLCVFACVFVCVRVCVWACVCLRVTYSANACDIDIFHWEDFKLPLLSCPVGNIGSHPNSHKIYHGNRNRKTFRSYHPMNCIKGKSEVKDVRFKVCIQQLSHL